MQLLNLNGNRLTKVPDFVLKGTYYDKLELDNNLLDIITSINNKCSISILGNPVLCNKKNVWLKHFEEGKICPKPMVSPDLVCSNNGVFAGVKWKDLTQQDMTFERKVIVKPTKAEVPHTSSLSSIEVSFRSHMKTDVQVSRTTLTVVQGNMALVDRICVRSVLFN